MESFLGRIRGVGMLEGISFLLLLGIAMPMKYLLGMPLAVRIVGSAHGVLFLLYVFMGLYALLRGHIGAKLAVKMVVASLVPFGPFVVDRELAVVAQGPAPAAAVRD